MVHMYTQEALYEQITIDTYCIEFLAEAILSLAHGAFLVPLASDL